MIKTTLKKIKTLKKTASKFPIKNSGDGEFSLRKTLEELVLGNKIGLTPKLIINIASYLSLSFAAITLTNGYFSNRIPDNYQINQSYMSRTARENNYPTFNSLSNDWIQSNELNYVHNTKYNALNNIFFSINKKDQIFKQNLTEDYPKELEYVSIKPKDYIVFIDKYYQTLSVYQLSYIKIFETDCSTGKNQGKKQRQGDGRTPEGIFKIISIEKSDTWRYDNELAYGPWFLRINSGRKNNEGELITNQRSPIGIHGTNEPNKLGIFNGNFGYGASHGCIRLNNDDVIYLKNNFINIGTPVVISCNMPRNIFVYKNNKDNFNNYHGIDLLCMDNIFEKNLFLSINTFTNLSQIRTRF